MSTATPTRIRQRLLHTPWDEATIPREDLDAPRLHPGWRALISPDPREVWLADRSAVRIWMTGCEALPAIPWDAYTSASREAYREVLEQVQNEVIDHLAAGREHDFEQVKRFVVGAARLAAWCSVRWQRRMATPAVDAVIARLDEDFDRYACTYDQEVNR